METALEKSFFDAFEFGGVAFLCIHGITESWGTIAKQQEKQRIISQTDAFDFSIINRGRKAPIIQEIENNLRTLAGRARENYLYSLLIPFAGWVRVVNGEAGEYETDWSKKNLQELHEKINSIIEGDSEKGSIERALQEWNNALLVYSNRLDALLLQEGEDLLELQKIVGVKLLSYRDITALGFYIGSITLAQKYIDALPKAVPKRDVSEPQPKSPKQQQKSQPERGKGRPKETLKEKMINDADRSKLQKVHTVMNGKKGKDAALIVLACMKKGWMQKPTFTQVAEEFGDIGVQQGFTKYLNENRFTKDEIEGAMNSLD